MAAAYRNGDAQEPVRELVVLQRVLAHEVNRGYDNLEPEIVNTIDGVRPRDLARALELAEGSTAPYLSVELEFGRLVVPGQTAVRRRQENILKTYSVPAGRSVELNRKGQYTGRSLRSRDDIPTQTATRQIQSLILGAWGCGAFGNDGAEIAGLFRRAPGEDFRGAFEHVRFSIADWSDERRFIRPFQEAFE